MDDHIPTVSVADHDAVTALVRDLEARLVEDTVRAAQSEAVDILLRIRILRDTHGLLQAVERGADLMGARPLPDDLNSLFGD